MSRYDYDREGLASLFSDLPRYRIEQIRRAFLTRFAEPAEVHEVPASLRRRLAESPELAASFEVARDVHTDDGATRKWLLRLNDGALIETVLMHHERHSTVCVSSQAGCAMACTFCATGDAGFTRHLSRGEIVEQVALAGRAARAGGRRLDHVVFMGMGEPLANFTNVESATLCIVDEIGLASRHVTISTVGVVPGIKRLTGFDRQVNLAVSLHAANDELRNTLVPLNRRYPIARLVEACKEYVEATHRRISLEWALIDGVNDSPTEARELVPIARELRAHVNLIPLNPTEGGLSRGLRGSPVARVRRFRDTLVAANVNVTLRRSRGREISAACGQLAGAATADNDPIGLRARAG
ncbi:MAG: 23S rRNA (adenine(2503)-C(2))-methyltransferase RlmN [Acidimicrobiales bacterium]